MGLQWERRTLTPKGDLGWCLTAIGNAVSLLAADEHWAAVDLVSFAIDATTCLHGGTADWPEFQDVARLSFIYRSAILSRADDRLTHNVAHGLAAALETLSRKLGAFADEVRELEAALAAEGEAT